jgi:hypothetical protein
MSNLITRNYESLTDYLAEVCDDTRPIKPGLTETSHNTGRVDFTWTDTFEEAVELARDGWAEGTAKVVEHREKAQAFLSAAKTAKTREFGWDVEGQFIDVGRLLGGEPECCGAEFDGGNAVASRVVSLRVNQAVSCSVDADAICARGVTVLCAVDLLESCGIRCEIILSIGNISTGGQGSVRNRQVESHVVLKRASDPVDLDRLAFWIAHPASFRRFGFRWLEQQGLSPRGSRPHPLADRGRDPSIVEVDEVCTATGLSPKQLQDNVLAIARACGLEFDADELAAIAACGKGN